jgi:diguanylate cyclase (GGDEF)-like protein
MTAEGPLTHLLDRAGALMGRPSAPQAPPEGGGQQMHALLELVPVGIWQLGPDGRTVFANRRLAAFLGGVTPASYGDAGLEPAGPALATHCAGQEWEATLHRPGRVPLRLLVAAAALADGGRLLAIQDVSPLKAAQERIEHLTGHDALTGLANRAALRLGLDAMARDPKGGSLLLINLDDLKAANQRHGLAAGDALLRCAAQRLREAVRPSDLVARLGGDEFAVLAFGAQAADALRMAERVRASFALPSGHGEAGRAVPGSIGVACAPDHGLDAERLLRAADFALQAAKAQGGDTALLFEPALRDSAEAKVALREAFVEALATDELELHLQPQRDGATGRLVGVEALIRWNSLRLGRWVPPLELLAAAQDAGLLRRLDQWVLRAAIRLQREWRHHPGAPARMGINISISTLLDPRFPAEVAEALLGAGLPPDQLEIEIPEDLVVGDVPAVARTLAALRDIGVALSLDDFGGGHSGLLHVVQLPVQRLKLDRSIVSCLPDDPKAYAVLRATMALARGMGIEVIGEGVETAAQAQALRRVGCCILQGWLLGRPVPPERLLAPTAPPSLAAS